MTPAQEAALIAVATAGLDDALRSAYAALLDLIRAGVAPRDAVQQVLATFEGAMAATLATAFSAILGEAVGSPAVIAMQVGAVTLSARLFAEAASTAQVVQGLVERQARGFQDARALALELFEGYGFRDPDAEPLQFNPRNDKLPRYLREVLLTDSGLAGQIERAMARMQVDGLTNQALRAAYRGVLDALAEIEAGAGDELLTKRLQGAFFERMRFFSRRIAETELHRAFAQRQALELLDDADVEWVQWRLNPSHPRPDICDYFAGVNRWGLGPGVYPKRQAPVAPAHPFCRCVLSPRLDLTGRRGREVPGADLAVFRALDPAEARQVAGSAEKLRRIVAGADPVAVHNERIDPRYKVRTAEEVAAGKPAVLQGAA
jgi:hypothetical protein